MPAFYWIKKILFIMNRKLLFLERFIYGDGTVPKNVTFTVKMRGTITMKNLRLALAKVQARHPALTAGVVEDDQGRPWFVSPAQPPEIPLRIAERLSDEHWLQESEIECSIPFDMRNGPLLRIVWLHSPAVSDLMLVCHHCICDGASIVTLCREILSVLDHPETVLTPYNSFNSIQDLVPQQVLQDKGIRFKARLVSFLLRMILRFTASRREIPWGRSYTVRWRVSKEATSALTQRCKEEAVTMHATLCVAFLSAFRYIKGNKAGNKVFCPVNIRRYISAIQEDMLLGFATSTTLSMDANPELSFFEKVKKLNADLAKKLAGMNVYAKLTTCEYQHALAKKLEQYFSNARGKHDLTFSNMGCLDIPKHFDSFEVEAVHNPILIFKSANPNGILASTFDGQLSFSLFSNDSYLDHEEAAAIRDSAMELLFETIEIKQHAEKTHYR
jgi:NRPS condensation-like uncharacterized protein